MFRKITMTCLILFCTMSLSLGTTSASAQSSVETASKNTISWPKLQALPNFGKVKQLDVPTLQSLHRERLSRMVSSDVAGEFSSVEVTYTFSEGDNFRYNQHRRAKESVGDSIDPLALLWAVEDVVHFLDAP
ncbi:hypothetical protein ACL02P_13385 [Paenibacillus sp. MB22_1]|uniref:hypothetical protein n=1 Tax=Paenibacillus sp. MB22_1 TaxID=3383121 RepID=UPI0039A066B0